MIIIKRITFSFSFFLLFLLFQVNVFSQTNHYINPTATGTNDGSDWTNAFTSIPDGLIRGDTYYLADGTYSSYICDDAESGDSYITIKKAIISDHGTETGWDASYGDGVALIEGYIQFVTGNYIIDGQTGGGPDNWFTGHGIKIKGTTEHSKLLDLKGARWYIEPLPNNFVFKHIELEHRGRNTNTRDDGLYTLVSNPDGDPWDNEVGPRNVHVSHCYFHDFGRMPVNTFACSDWVFEYNCVSRNTSNSIVHAEGWQDFGSDNMTIRYNYFLDCEGTGVIVQKKNFPLTNENWEVYGNIFAYSEENRTTWKDFEIGHGVFTQTAENNTPCNNMKFYNNTIVNIAGWRSGFWFVNGSNNEAYNNLWYNCINYTNNEGDGPNVHLGDESGGVVFDYNQYNDSPLLAMTTASNDIESTGDIFIDWRNNDFRLIDRTVSGVVLDEKYSYDMYGTKRGTNGSWCRGAIQFTDETFNLEEVCDENIFVTFPNPTNGSIHISVDDFIQAELKTIDGTLLLVSKEKDLDISHLPSGIYLITVVVKNFKSFTNKIIKE